MRSSPGEFEIRARIIDLEEVSRLSFSRVCLVVGQPFQAVVLTGWKAGLTEEGDKPRVQSAPPFTLRTSNPGH
jgi:hypothetical protein